MKFLTSGQFWGGVIVGYLLLTIFPQLSIRTMGAGKKMKG